MHASAGLFIRACPTDGTIVTSKSLLLNYIRRVVQHISTCGWYALFEAEKKTENVRSAIPNSSGEAAPCRDARDG